LDPDPDPDPLVRGVDLDPHQNVTDPQHYPVSDLHREKRGIKAYILAGKKAVFADPDPGRDFFDLREPVLY
jgi:hypothetical protein